MTIRPPLLSRSFLVPTSVPGLSFVRFTGLGILHKSITGHGPGGKFIGQEARSWRANAVSNFKS